MTPTIIPLDDALNRLNRISSAITALQREDELSVIGILDLIVRSAVELVPGARVVVWLYDPIKGALDPLERAAAGNGVGFDPPGVPGLAVMALEQKVNRLDWEWTSYPAGPALAACFPLVAGGERMGVLAAGRVKQDPFQAVELTCLEHLAGLAALALWRSHQAILAQQEQVQRERQLRRLRRAGMLISSRSSLKDTLDAILRMALEITDASYGIFRLVDPSGKFLVTQSYVGHGLETPAVENLPIGDTSVMGYVANQREPVVISDLRASDWRNIYYPFDQKLEMRSEVAVPLIGASGRLEGVVNLESLDVNAFDKEDRYILQILATQAVVAIQEVRLLDALQDIAAMLYTHSLPLIHQALVERACDLLNVPVSLIWLLEKDRLVVRAVTDLALCDYAMNLGDGPTSRAIRAGEPVALLELKPEEIEVPGLAGAGSALIVPLAPGNERKPGGAFSVYTAPGDVRDFSQSDWDKRVLNILGHYATLAVQNASHLEALKLAEDQRATTETFAAIGDIAANLLHRLNNKVGTIPVRVEGIQDKCEALLQADPYLATNLAEIQRSAAEAMQVVRESLDHLRPIQLAPVSVAACIQEALASTRLPAEVQIETVGLDYLPAVQAGADRLSLVFANLLDNASDAMHGHGKIRILGAAREKWVEIRVCDTGPGIQAELVERIFEFSYSSRTAHPGKLGFGLWWVKSWMTRFGGRVAVESSGNEGTTFIVSLPLAGGEV
jgi:signal transduction histidine kinase/putative methionine-R-sulfoxide reductase with GAF domain